MELSWTPAALGDLDQAFRFIAEDSSLAAGATADRILESVENLLVYPNLGRPGRVRGTRELIVSGSPFIVIYRVQMDEIQVLRMLHYACRWSGA